MKERHNTAVAWLEKANHDFAAATIIKQYLPTHLDTIAFHCQQATEKSIKAILVNLGKDFKRTHDLSYLLEMVAEYYTVNTEDFKKVIILNNYSVEVRYPNSTIVLSSEEMDNAIDTAAYFIEMAVTVIGRK